jgi:hypothetical protein
MIFAFKVVFFCLERRKVIFFENNVFSFRVMKKLIKVTNEQNQTIQSVKKNRLKKC